MKFSLLLLLALNQTPAQTALRGEPLSFPAWKSAVRLKGGGGSCTAVFIARDLILTAAHCRFHQADSLRIEFFPGNSTSSRSLNLSYDDFVVSVHPDFGKKGPTDPGRDDLALIYLPNTSLPEGFAPAQTLFAGTGALARPKQPLLVIGAGQLGSGDPANNLSQVHARVHSVVEHEMLDGDVAVPAGLCSGDSGAPVFLRANGHIYLAGILSTTSFGVAKNCGGSFVATSINAARSSWITEKAAKLRARRR